MTGISKFIGSVFRIDGEGFNYVKIKYCEMSIVAKVSNQQGKNILV